MDHDDSWKNKAAKAPFQRKSNCNPNSKTDQSRAALFEVEFVAQRPAQSRPPHTILTPRWPWRTETWGSAKFNLKNVLPDDIFQVAIIGLSWLRQCTIREIKLVIK